MLELSENWNEAFWELPLHLQASWAFPFARCYPDMMVREDDLPVFRHQVPAMPLDILLYHRSVYVCLKPAVAVWLYTLEMAAAGKASICYSGPFLG